MKRIKLFLTALVLSLSSMFTLAVPRALAATATWDGGGGDDNMTTDANWVGDTAPSADDDLVFPAADAGTVVNDFAADTSFNSITFTGVASGSGYSFSGARMEIATDISDETTGGVSHTYTISNNLIFDGTSVITSSGGGFLTLTGVISGSGNLVFAGGGSIRLEGANTFTGTAEIQTQVYAFEIDAMGGTAGGTTLSTSGRLDYTVDEADKAGTLAEPFVLSIGDDGSDGAVLSMDAACGFSLCDGTDITLSGDITFSANTLLGTSGQLTLTGALAGSGKTISLSLGSPGTLVIDGSSNNTDTANGTYGAGVKTERTLSDNKPSAYVVVPDSNTYVITGTYGQVTIYPGGTLKGTGTVSTIYVANGGTLAPGESPGCLSSGSLTFVSGSTYEFEVGGTEECTEYDQTQVTGAVDLGSGTLSVLRYDDYVPTAGEKYVIINNDEDDEVTGTFADLEEGDTFEADGVTYSISYVGGDGNDVELTVTAVSPDTGFAVLTNNPYVTMALMLGAAGTIAFMARRSLKPAFRKR